MPETLLGLEHAGRTKASKEADKCGTGRDLGRLEVGLCAGAPTGREVAI